jgi:diaminohydroxyphosphoribosylaminopyrimidine deaminase / 5-amino-6-(5-phosphoribosylamino)uracil reductase
MLTGSSTSKAVPAGDRDERFLWRALELAEEGTGLVSPNPLVGCVIVSPTGDVAGEGTYRYEQVIHAELIALAQAGDAARGGTAYVSLEPHDHHGRTPPCTDALIDAGIKRVVCPIEDPNPLVSGRGFAKLRAAGIEVVTGILAEEAARQNEKFICWHRLGRPFVRLKLAMSLDGRISLDRSASTAISGEAARERVHSLRHQYDAILIGANTAVSDDPHLTDRSGKSRRRPLTRVILDSRLRLGIDSNLVRSARDIPTIVFTGPGNNDKAQELRRMNVEVIERPEGTRDLAAVLDDLRRRDIQGVLVEGGSTVAGAFCDGGLVDKITFILAPVIIGGPTAPRAIEGRGAPTLDEAVRLTHVTTGALGEDIEITGYPEQRSAR